MFLMIMQANPVSRNDPASSRESRHTSVQKNLGEKRIKGPYSLRVLLSGGRQMSIPLG